MDGELRRAVATAARRGRSAQRRRLGRVVRVGTVHEDLRRRNGRAQPAVRQSQAERVGQAVRGPGHGGGRVQRTRVRTGVGEDGGRGAPATDWPAAPQCGGRGRRPADGVLRPARRGRCQGRLSARPVRLAPQRKNGVRTGRVPRPVRFE